MVADKAVYAGEKNSFHVAEFSAFRGGRLVKNVSS